MPLLVIVFIRLFSTIHTRFFFVCDIVGKRTESNSILTASSRRRNRNALSWDRIGNLRHSFLGTSLPRINSISCYSHSCHHGSSVFEGEPRLSIMSRLTNFQVIILGDSGSVFHNECYGECYGWYSLASERRPLWISTSTEDSTTSTRLLLVQTCESVPSALTPAKAQYFRSLTKEVAVEDKVATMQVRHSETPPFVRLLIHLLSYGIQQAKNVSSLSGSRSTAVPTVVFWCTTSTMRSHSIL